MKRCENCESFIAEEYGVCPICLTLIKNRDIKSKLNYTNIKNTILKLYNVADKVKLIRIGLVLISLIVGFIKIISIFTSTKTSIPKEMLIEILEFFSIPIILIIVFLVLYWKKRK